ncbi:hypothetical protein [Bradyrhizobium sp. DOA9]|uniref:hypothetical protein n=1 Tax=Bradyrhizobium sp. DOA9 TaxID=1126627 RepID=UPI000468112D|nr:hypothetical protein [Bradyrhizobium sp. DOA9]GAJ35245.1 hypothetical protein BDOA9_0144460 [Bradyrhizobium sp. DOA9]
MPLLSLTQVLALTGTPFQKFQTLRRRDQIAMAFGRRTAAASLDYIPADCVGMMLVDALGEAYGGKLTFPAQLVRVYGDTWLECVAHAEAGLMETNAQDVSFCVIDCERESDGKAGHMVMGTMGNNEQTLSVVQHMMQQPGWFQRRMNCVNVSLIIRRIRRAANDYNEHKPVEEQIDLSTPFMPFPGTDEYKTLMDADYFKQRDKAVDEVNKLKRREQDAAKFGDKARALVLQ